MCGRFSLTTEQMELTKLFDLPATDWGIGPRYNIAPNQHTLILRRSETGNREWALLRWGLIPRWAKDGRVGFRNINARAESVATKPTFRDSFRARRCIVPASGFYEWRRMEGQRAKQPYYIRPTRAEPFAFAGLWDRWAHGPDHLESFAIITTESNEVVRSIHHRMPVILTPDLFDAWLDPRTDSATLNSILRPSSSSNMTTHPVSSYVNRPTNDGPQCIETSAPPNEPQQGHLPF